MIFQIFLLYLYRINIYYILNQKTKTIMRKGLIAMLIAFSFAVVSCGGAKEEATEETSVETVETVETEPAVEEAAPAVEEGEAVVEEAEAEVAQ